MEILEFLKLYKKHPLVKEACGWLRDRKGNVLIDGIQGSARSLLIALLHAQQTHDIIVVMENEDLLLPRPLATLRPQRDSLLPFRLPQYPQTRCR